MGNLAAEQATPATVNPTVRTREYLTQREIDRQHAGSIRESFRGLGRQGAVVNAVFSMVIVPWLGPLWVKSGHVQCSKVIAILPRHRRLAA
jgi:hypothetical protein